MVLTTSGGRILMGKALTPRDRNLSQENREEQREREPAPAGGLLRSARVLGHRFSLPTGPTYACGVRLPVTPVTVVCELLLAYRPPGLDLTGQCENVISQSLGRTIRTIGSHGKWLILNRSGLPALCAFAHHGQPIRTSSCHSGHGEVVGFLPRTVRYGTVYSFGRCHTP